MKRKMEMVTIKAQTCLQKLLTRKHDGLDGIMVTVGLCIIALLLCVVMKDELADFVGTIVGALETRATGILNPTS